ELPAVQDRHQQVEQDQVGGRVGRQKLQGRLSVPDGYHVVPLARQDTGELLAGNGVVLHHQDVTLLHGPARFCKRRDTAPADTAQRQKGRGTGQAPRVRKGGTCPARCVGGKAACIAASTPAVRWPASSPPVSLSPGEQPVQYGGGWIGWRQR